MTRILIVDHDPASRAVVRNALVAGLSATVTECADGASALDALARERYSLLVTELQLPAMSGIEMLTAVRVRARTLPVIILTGTCDDTLVRRVIGLGIGDFLIKPVNADRLCARARALVPPAPAASPAEPAAEAGARHPPRSVRVLLPPLPSPKR